jgi:septum formation protein
MKKIILASASERRKQILSMLNINFKAVSAHIDESIDKDMSPLQAVEYLAKSKAQAVSNIQAYKEDIIIGSDTIVCLGNKIFGKPRSNKDAFNMLSELSGKTHEVYTGVCVLNIDNVKDFDKNSMEFNFDIGDNSIIFSDCSKVTFYNLTDDEIYGYINTLEPMDKAGGYGIQGKGAKFVKRIEGDFYNIMGMPMSKLYRIISKLI